MGRLLGFVRDRSGSSSIDYVVVLAALCIALLLAGFLLDNDTQMRLQTQVFGLLGRH